MMHVSMYERQRQQTAVSHRKRLDSIVASQSLCIWIHMTSNLCVDWSNYPMCTISILHHEQTQSDSSFVHYILDSSSGDNTHRFVIIKYNWYVLLQNLYAHSEIDGQICEMSPLFFMEKIKRWTLQSEITSIGYRFWSCWFLHCHQMALTLSWIVFGEEIVSGEVWIAYVWDSTSKSIQYIDYMMEIGEQKWKHHRIDTIPLPNSFILRENVPIWTGQRHQNIYIMDSFNVKIRYWIQNVYPMPMFVEYCNALSTDNYVEWLHVLTLVAIIASSCTFARWTIDISIESRLFIAFMYLLLLNICPSLSLFLALLCW